MNIQALQGGLLKCVQCTFTFSLCNMDYTQAYSGGIFMVVDSSTGLVQYTSMQGTSSATYGGIMSVTSSGNALTNT